MAIQTTFRRHQQPGWVGGLSRPDAPYAYDMLPLHVPAMGRKARPGDAVLWNATENQVQVVAAAADTDNLIGIVAYDPSTVQSTLSTRPTDRNSDTYIEYEDNAIIKVMVLGHMWVIAGGNVEYGNLLEMQQDDWKWDAAAASAFASQKVRSVECVSLSGADNDIIEVRIGYGRVK